MEHTITITARSVAERNTRVRDLLKRGYVPKRFFQEERISEGLVQGRYICSNGQRRSKKEVSYRKMYCAVLRKAGGSND